VTAHAVKAELITPERVAWFAAYYQENPSWGIFHVCLCDGNWKLGSGDPWDQRSDVREACEFFNRLTPSQRGRLGRKAEGR